MTELGRPVTNPAKERFSFGSCNAPDGRKESGNLDMMRVIEPTTECRLPTVCISRDPRKVRGVAVPPRYQTGKMEQLQL